MKRKLLTYKKPLSNASAKQERLCALMKELKVLVEEMAYAMEQAHIPHVAKGRMTRHMEEVMERYYDWANAAMEAGL